MTYHLADIPAPAWGAIGSVLTGIVVAIIAFIRSRKERGDFRVDKDRDQLVKSLESRIERLEQGMENMRVELETEKRLRFSLAAELEAMTREKLQVEGQLHEQRAESDRLREENAVLRQRLERH